MDKAVEKGVNKAARGGECLLSALADRPELAPMVPGGHRNESIWESANLAELFRDKAAVLPTHRVTLGSRDKPCCRLCVAAADLAHDLP